MTSEPLLPKALGPVVNGTVYTHKPIEDTILPTMQDVVSMLVTKRRTNPEMFEPQVFRMQCFEMRGLVTEFFINHLKRKDLMWRQYRSIPDFQQAIQACKLAGAWCDGARDVQAILSEERNAYWAQWSRPLSSDTPAVLYKMWQVLFLFQYLEMEAHTGCLSKEYCQPPPKEAFNRMEWKCDDGTENGVFFTKEEANNEANNEGSEFSIPIHPCYFQQDFPMIWSGLMLWQQNKGNDLGCKAHVQAGFKTFISTLVGAMESRLTQIQTLEAKTLGAAATAFISVVQLAGHWASKEVADE